MSDYINREQVIDVLKETGIIQDNDLGHLVVDEINRIPTLDETEIIHKAFERVVDRLEEEKHSTLPTFDEDGYCNDDSWEVVDFDVAIEIVKEEGGVE